MTRLIRLAMIIAEQECVDRSASSASEKVSHQSRLRHDAVVHFKHGWEDQCQCFVQSQNESRFSVCLMRSLFSFRALLSLTYNCVVAVYMEVHVSCGEKTRTQLDASKGVLEQAYFEVRVKQQSGGNPRDNVMCCVFRHTLPCATVHEFSCSFVCCYGHCCFYGDRLKVLF